MLTNTKNLQQEVKAVRCCLKWTERLFLAENTDKEKKTRE